MPDLALLLPASQLFPSLRHVCVAAATNTTCSKAAKWNLGRMMQGTDDVRKERGRKGGKQRKSLFLPSSSPPTPPSRSSHFAATMEPEEATLPHAPTLARRLLLGGREGIFGRLSAITPSTLSRWRGRNLTRVRGRRVPGVPSPRLPRISAHYL